MRRQGNKGFTTTELVVAVSITAILAAVAVPSFKEASLSSQLRAASTELIASANLARSEAIKRNGVVRVCASSDGAFCTGGGWEQGWIVTSGVSVLQVIPAAPNGIHIRAGGATQLMFDATGVGATSATFTICRASPAPGRQERLVTVDAAGRTYSRKTTNGVCP